jgi:sec-independent protein translocase protein TatA
MFSGLLQPMHLLLILGVVLIVFGPGKLANVGHDLGKSIREFKAAMEARDVTPEVAAEKSATVQATPAAEIAAEKAGPAA